MDKAEKIVNEILADLTDIRGLRQKWDNISEEFQEEIKSEWIQIVRDNL